MKNIWKSSLILQVALLASVAFTLDGFCAYTDFGNDEETSVMPAAGQGFRSVQDAVVLTIAPSYYWGPISNMKISSTENQLYYTDERASNQRVRTLTVANNKLTADVQYQNLVDISNPHYENVYRETTTLDLTTGVITLTDGSKLTPADGDKYIAAVNNILSVERYQERSANSTQLATLTPVRNYLVNIKVQSGESKYFFGAGLNPMSIGTGASGARSVKVNVSNDRLLVSDIDKYTSYSMDLLSGDIVASFMSSGINLSTWDEAAYKTYVQGMLAMVNDAYNNTTDTTEKAKLRGVTNYLNKIIATPYYWGPISATIKAQAASFYVDILGRAGTAAEIDTIAKRIQLGAPLYTLAKEFFNSTEFQAKSSPNKIAALYRVILGRTPSATETTYWANLYDSGTSLSDIATLFTKSPEFAGKTTEFKTYVLTKINIVSATRGDKGPTAEAQVTAFYKNILGRAPESQTAITYWATALKQYGAAYVAKGIFSSTEFQAKSSPNKIAALYRVILGRTPSATETSYWANLYNRGTSLSTIASYFTKSSEFTGKPASFQNYVLTKINIVNTLALL